MDKSSALERLTRFDLVRVSKLLEMAQDGIIVFAIAFYVGSALDRLFNTLKPNDEKSSKMELIGILLLQFIANILLAYYLKKFVDIIPFFFSLSSGYNSNQKGESEFGSNFAASIILVSVQHNFAAKLNILKARFALN